LAAPKEEADALLEQELVHLAVLAKHLEATVADLEVASSVGYKIGAVIRARVEERLAQQ